MKPRILIAASLVALASCRFGADGTYGSRDVVVRADRRPKVRDVEPEAPPKAPEIPQVVQPATAAPAPLFDDRLPAPAVATEHVPKPWPFDVQSYAIRLTVDPKERAISGSVRIDVKDAADGLAELPLDAVGFEIARVWDDGEKPRETEFSYDGTTLRIPLTEPRRTGTSRSFEIEYSGRPLRGIYFNEGHPPQVYTQGEMEDSRYWFPCHDFPDDRATHVLMVTAPDDWTVVGAGRAPGPARVETDGRRVPRIFGLDVPHVSYLVSMTTGEYETITENGVVPLHYVVESRDKKFASANFRKTNDVLKFFGDATGLPYPYPTYSQTCVRHFMWGGMENISATTLTDHTIHPPDWEPARSSTSLVAHEAAHQWFGDWITCADWSHNWLNEGFATYYDALFTEHDEGRDAFLWEMRGNRHGALGAMDHERRAIVSNRWASAEEMFDGHAYAGGAARLHMLRHLLGDKEFHGAIRHYVKTCGLKCVTTDDFENAVEEFTGQDLTWFFDQWFRKPGYPVLKIRWTWDEAKKAIFVTVEQTQGTDGGAPEAYRLPLDVELGTWRIHGEFQGVERFVHRLNVTKRIETFEIRHDRQPMFVQPDPETAILARFDLERSVDDWIAEVSLDVTKIFSGHNPALRQDAAEALAGIVKDEKRAAPDRDKAHAALLEAFRQPGFEDFAQFLAALAGQVASRKDDATAQVLIDAMNSDADLRVRLAASDALHGFDGNAKARDALALHLDDANDLMRASAVAGVAKLKHPQAFEHLVAALDKPGWHSVVRVAALRGFADLGDERAFATLVRFAAPGDDWSRTTAIDSLGRMGRKKPEYREAVLTYLDDPVRDVRREAAQALGKIADPDTIPTLCAHFATETWPGVKDALRNAVKACRAAAVEEGRLVTVEAARAHEIREKHAPLRDEADAVEESIKTLAGDAKTAAEARLKTLHAEMAPLQRDLDALGVPVKPKPKPPAPSAPAAK